MTTIVGGTRLALVHAKYALLEQSRVPIAIISSLAFPVLIFCFFVLPVEAVRENPAAATATMFAMIVFAFMSNGLFPFGLDLAQQRELPWVPYLRTLPGPPASRLAGLVLSTLVTASLAMVLVLTIGLLFTAARPEPLAVVVAGLAVIVSSVPSALLGLIIGTACSAKAAIAVTQLVMFTTAFASGLFMPPEVFPAWLELGSRILPVRAARDLTISIALGEAIPVWAIPVLLAWTIALGVIGIRLYRRDEGRRFR